LGNNGPDQGQTLAAADRWRTDGTERELAMLIEVRGGRSRYFSVPQSPIYCSLSSPPLLCLEAPSPPPRPPPRAMPFDPACRASQLTLCAPVRVRVVFADGAQVQGRGRARHGDQIIALSGTILGDGRPGSPPPPVTAGRSNPACCVEKQTVRFTMCRAVWLRLFAGLMVEVERASRVFVHQIDA
jgi:hypothetical protein